MKLPKLSERLSWRLLMSLAAAAIAFGVFFRVYGLGFPDKQVFDEVYFPVFANQYLHRIDVFDVHPPFGKFLIAGGIAALGENVYGWRIVPLLFGLGNIALMSYLWWSLFKDRVGALIIGSLVAIDGMFMIYSRTGLMDGILFFFIFLSLLLMVKARPSVPMIWVATALGLTASIKWVGLAVLVPVLFLAFRKARWKELLFALPWSFIVYMGTVAAGEVLDGQAKPCAAAIEWNQQAANYHATITATHPYSSQWWSWPLLQKPVLFLYDVMPDGLVQVMTTRGNTFVWWASGLAVLAAIAWLIEKRFLRREPIATHPFTLFLLGYGACVLPWVPVHRVLFIYHYMPAYGFALLILTYWLSRMWARGWRLPVFGFLLVAIGVAVWQLPVAVGWIPVEVDWALRLI